MFFYETCNENMNNEALYLYYVWQKNMMVDGLLVQCLLLDVKFFFYNICQSYFIGFVYMNVLRIFIHILELTGLRFIVNYRTTKIESNKDQMWNWHYYLHLLYYTLFSYLEDNYLFHFIFLQSSLLFYWIL